MGFYEELKKYKERNGLNNRDLGEIIGKSPDAFRIAVKRESLTALEKDVLEKLFALPDFNEQKKPPTELEARFEDIVARRVIEIITPILEKLGENQKSALGSVDDFKVTMQHLLLDLDELKDEIEEVKDLVKQSDSKLDKLV